MRLISWFESHLPCYICFSMYRILDPMCIHLRNHDRPLPFQILHFCVILFMRAYAIVRKPQPVASLHQHVIKVTREQPKISIDAISENRLTSPHKAASAYSHELQNSGAFFKLSGQLEKQSNKSSVHGLPEKQEPVGVRVEKGQEGPILQIEQQHPRAARTKKLFQEFPVSPAKPKEQEFKEYKEEKLNSTPVRLLQPDPEPILPVEQVVDGHHRKVKIFEHNQHLEAENNDIVYQSDSKNVFCCGQVSADSNSEPKQQPQQIVFSKLPPQPQTKERHDSSKKRKIFQDFEDRDHVVEQFTFKDQRVSNRNMPSSEREGDRTLRIKIYEFAALPPFDI